MNMSEEIENFDRMTSKLEYIVFTIWVVFGTAFAIIFRSPIYLIFVFGACFLIVVLGRLRAIDFWTRGIYAAANLFTDIADSLMESFDEMTIIPVTARLAHRRVVCANCDNNFCLTCDGEVCPRCGSDEVIGRPREGVKDDEMS